ncbi:MAG: hypothetical protein IJN29_02160 [Akkermansia sp.]|nr:hypothetical protein [Akkermansia sp.]
MPAKRRSLLLPALCLLSACTSLPQWDFFALLPTKGQSSTTTLHPHPDYKPLLSYTFYREGQNAIVGITYGPDFHSRGYRVVPELVRRAYGSLWGRTRTESLADCATGSAEDALRLCIPAERLRHSGGPWDYTLRLNLLSPEGKILRHIDARLNDECPEPGALSHNPDLFDRTYSRNSRSLQHLQQAAARCAAVRLLSQDFLSDKEVNKLLSRETGSTLCRLIARMQPVHTQIMTVTPSGTCTLHLLDTHGAELAEISVYDVTAAENISPENVGKQKRYKLSNDDAATWFHLIKQNRE